MNFNPLCIDQPLMDAKFTDEDCCVVQDINPCALVYELLKISGYDEIDLKKVSDSLFAGRDLKAEIVDNNITLAVEIEERPKKRVRFSEELPRKQILDYETKENLNPKEDLPMQEDDVSEFDAKMNRWSDDPRESRLYSLNCRLNQIDSNVTDRDEYEKNMPAIPIKEVEESRIRNWHNKGPKPLRFLMAVMLTTNDILGNLKKLSLQDIVKIKKMIDELANDLESGRREFCYLYEYGVNVTNIHLKLLKIRSKKIENYLVSLK